jgi:hypothetical protein
MKPVWNETELGQLAVHAVYLLTDGSTSHNVVCRVV